MRDFTYKMASGQAARMFRQSMLPPLYTTVSVHQMGERRGVYRVLVGRRETKNCLEDLVVDVRIVLKWNFKKWVGKA